MSTMSIYSCSSIWRLALAAVLGLICFATAAEPAPMVIEPSQYWEGNDGPWSTFSMQIGDSKNVTRVLVSTAIPNQWVVLQQACNTSTCATSRGDNLFNPNKSSTWNSTGVFNLYYEETLGYKGNGQYGFDKVGLGLNPTNASTATDQIVVGIISEDFWLGYIGVNPQVTNFENFSNPLPSLIQSFKDDNSIPSLSYSYTAGAQYRNKGVYGQLIIGGYDTSRFQNNSVDFNMASDITRDLVVGIQSFQSEEKSGRTTNLLNEGIFAYVDSTVPWIILPDDACDTIEKTFGIKQDATTGLYLVSDSQHNALVSRNPTFTFVLGNDKNGGDSVPISLPYSAFDLQISAPYVKSPGRYFPLKRGNDTTYTLGRAFLQEAYLTANYEHQNFSISQTTFLDGATKSVQPIHALGYVAPPGSGSSDSGSGSGSSGGVSTAAIVGIVIAVVIIIIAIATLAVLRRLRRWPFHNRPPIDVPELDGNGNAIGHEKDGVAVVGRRGLFGRKNVAVAMAEADSKDSLHGYYRPELAGTDGTAHKSELPGAISQTRTARGELAGSHGATEVEGSPGIVMELPGSPVGEEYYYGRAQSAAVSPASKGGLSPGSPRPGSEKHSPVSPRRGSDMRPSNDQLSPDDRRPSRVRGSRTPVSPQSPDTQYGSQYGSHYGSRAGSTYSDGRN